MAETTRPYSRRFVSQLLDSLHRLRSSSPHNFPESNPLGSLPESARKQLLSLQVLFPNEFVPALDLLDRRLVTRFHIGQVGLAEGQGHGGSIHAVARTEESAIQAASERDQVPQSNNGKLDHSEDDRVMPDAPAQGVMQTTLSAAPTIQTSIRIIPHNTIYYVRSAQQRSSRFSASYDTTTSYEVRLQAWNCSCPAFAFAAFPAIHPDPPLSLYEPRENHYQQQNDNDEKEETEPKWYGEDGTWSFGGMRLSQEMPPVCKHLLACVLVERCSSIFGACVEERNVSVAEAAGWAAGWGD